MRTSFPTILLLAMFLACASAGHAQFSDDFSDGNFTANPEWSGNASLFTVNASQQLQLNDVTAGQASLGTSYAPASLDLREWSVWVKQSFAGSDNNQSRIYLAASGIPASYAGAGSAGVSGYFLKLGEAGSADAIKLCRDDGSGNTTELLAGTASFIASSFEVRIRVRRDASGNWSLEADGSGGTAYTPQGTVTDVTYDNSSATGVVCLYTSSNADNFFFDDFYFGEYVTDTTPPTVTSATAVTATTLQVNFSEAVEASSAETENNYSVNGIGVPTSATLSGATVTLSFATSFPENTALTLTTGNVTDLAGNSMATTETDFLWFVPANAGFREVVFNEVLADPTPVVGLPEAEYVELYNPSSNAFDLGGWSFVNSTTVKVLPAYTLAPGAFVVLCEDDFAALFPSAIGISSFTALTNSSDSLTLIDTDGEIIDILVYTSDWFESSEKAEGGWSLEQVNPDLACFSSDNWRESSSATGGTPAALNSVDDPTPDTQAPVVLSVNVLNPVQLEIAFSETMDESSLADASFDLQPFFVLTGFQWSNDRQSLFFTCDPAIQTGVTYTLLVDGLADCSGNSMEAFSGTIVLGAAPSAGDILINEIMADPEPQVQGPLAEYIELYNRGDQLVDLRLCTLNSGVFSSTTLLAPGAYLIVADDADAAAFAGYPAPVLLTSFPSLTNTGGSLVLADADGNMIDQVDYSDDWYGDADKSEGGWSLERIDPFDPCSDASNWTASMDPRGMTAGEQNSVYSDETDTDAPDFILVVNEPQDAVTVYFDEPLQDPQGASFSWTIDGVEQDPANAFVDGASPAHLVLLTGELEAGSLHTIVVTGVTDCWGNSSGSLTIQVGIPVAAQVGDIVINEILFDPYTGGYDFIELFNRSARPISLAGWFIANEADGVVGDAEIITESGLVLLPGEYLVVTEDGSLLPSFYPFTRTERVWTMDDLPSFNIDAGTAYLLMANTTICDRMSYTEDLHFPLLDDTDGVSLERIDADRPSDDLTNWLSAAEAQGFATPGYINSQAYSAGLADEQVSVDPEIFSPDNDGYQDVVTIGWQLAEGGRTGNITLFDSEGRRVRRLMRNGYLGTEGSISWNGTGDEGQSLPIGIYVIHFEVYTPDGKISVVKKTCVLAHALD